MGHLSYLNSVYAIVSERTDEKRLVKEIEAVFNTKLRKKDIPSLLKAREPRKLEYFYAAIFPRADALYLELTPNRDEAGVLEAADYPDCAWILIVRAIPVHAVNVSVDFIAQRATEKVERLCFPTKFVRNQD